MPLRSFLGCMMIGMIVAGCSSGSELELATGESTHASYVAETVTEASELRLARRDDGSVYLDGAAQQNIYTLDSGDRVRVEVFGQPNLSRLASVDGGGFISLPLIGAVNAKGHTTFSLARVIALKLGQRYVRDPKVTVQISTYRPFFILGEVRTPGKFSYENGMTVRTAVAIAGGYTPRAEQGTAKITRTIKGETVTMEVPFNHPVRPGDTIYVVERFL